MREIPGRADYERDTQSKNNGINKNNIEKMEKNENIEEQKDCNQSYKSLINTKWTFPITIHKNNDDKRRVLKVYDQ